MQGIGLEWPYDLIARYMGVLPASIVKDAMAELHDIAEMVQN